MTLMDAKEYDDAAARRKRFLIVSIIGALLAVGFVVYRLRYWPEERLVDKFFASLQKQDYETAYSIYRADQGWKQHGQQHADYPFSDFYRDWGPGGEWGLIKSYKIYASGECPKGGSGVVVEVIVNDRADHEQL